MNTMIATGDQTLRIAERAWRTNETPEAASVYLTALNRRGLLPDMTPKPRVWTAAKKAVFNGRKQNNADVATARDGAKALFSYDALVAFYDPGTNVMLWSEEAAFSVTSRKHVTRWSGELGYAKRIAVELCIIELETTGLDS